MAILISTILVTAYLLSDWIPTLSEIWELIVSEAPTVIIIALFILSNLLY